MTTTGYSFTEEQAAQIVSRLHRCIDELSESVRYADAECSEEVVRPYKHRIAEIMADLGWDVLEQGFYQKYPQLRPYELKRDSKD
jgi:hypothetical protein